MARLRRIVLGLSLLSLVSVLPSDALTTLLTDNFNRANVSPLAGIWSTMTGAGNLDIVSNALQVGAVSNDGQVRNNSVTWPNDHWAEVTITTLNNGFAGAGVLLRAATGANTTYRCSAVGPFGASTAVRIDKIVAGSYTAISSSTATVATTDALRCEVQGTTLTLKINGVTRVGPSTDSSIASGSAGIMVFVDPGGAVTDGVVDNFTGGDFTGGSTRRRILVW
jgi:hypothetical protein